MYHSCWASERIFPVPVLISDLDRQREGIAEILSDFARGMDETQGIGGANRIMAIESPSESEALRQYLRPGTVGQNGRWVIYG